MHGPLFNLLFTLFAGAEFGPVPTVAARTPLAVALAAAHHCRRAAFMLIDAEREKADHVLIDVGLTLELSDRRSGGVEVEHHIMRLAVLGDAIGQAAQAPGLGLDDLAAIFG